MGLEFPYRLTTICYVEIHQNGNVAHGTDAGTYQRALAGESRLFAVWPGQYRSDLFVIDDLDQYARAFGIVHDEERTGLAEHEHRVRWSTSDFEDSPGGTYINIDVWLDCGCEIRDLDTFASQMRDQRGWHIVTSRGWGSSGGVNGENKRYSLRARRRSLS